MVESAVGTHLLNRRKAGWYNVFYWNENSKEVDYVIQRGSDVVAIEVKSGYDSSNAGMAVFNELFHPKAMFTVGTDGISSFHPWGMEKGWKIAGKTFECQHEGIGMTVSTLFPCGTR